MAIGKEGNVKWVDGLRGIASTLVVLTHIARAFDGDLFLPTSSETSPPRLLQWPFIRVLVQGRIGVTVFAFVTGYVCALKPIRLCLQGEQEKAYASIGRSALRRVPRLVLPAALATAIIWLLTQFGVFLVAKRCDSWWAGATSPDATPYLGDSIKALVYNIVTTWTRGKNDYDGNQWTLLPLLKGSFWVYVYVLATGHVQQRYRMLGSFGMWLYFFISSDSAFGMQFFWGVLLADLQNNETSNLFLSTHQRLCRLFSGTLIFLGLLIASFPEGHAEWMTWSRIELSILTPLLPENPDFPRFSSGIGLELISLGLHFSPWIREHLLSNRHLLWLGRQSFAVYLLHGPLLRWVLVWTLYGVSLPVDSVDDKGELVRGPALPFPGRMRYMVSLAAWVPLVYAVAVAWTTYVDPWCARVTERLVGRVVLRSEEKRPVLPS